LLGIVCIYSNRPIFTPKKIRYKYPGQEWQEIAGDRFTLEEQPDKTFAVYINPQAIVTQVSRMRIDGHIPAGTLFDATVLVAMDFQAQRTDRFIGTYIGWEWANPFTSNGNATFNHLQLRLNYIDANNNINFVQLNPTISLFQLSFWFADAVSRRVDQIILNPTNPVITPGQCELKIFDINNNLIFSQSSDVCPDVEIIPAKCEYKQENEKLVKKWIVGFFQNLRVEYQSNCATVWLDSPPFFPTQVYKECSDPECSPPRIRFDKKCEEPCKKCPPGTVTRVLNGRNLLCVDGRGCLIKTIKFDSKCESYDCVC
jgi:hypothetical protein